MPFWGTGSEEGVVMFGEKGGNSISIPWPLSTPLQFIKVQELGNWSKAR